MKFKNMILLIHSGGIRENDTSCLVTDPIKNENRIVFGDTFADLDNPIQIVRYDLVVIIKFII